jgi:hypothetical protein
VGWYERVWHGREWVEAEWAAQGREGLELANGGVRGVQGSMGRRAGGLPCTCHCCALALALLLGALLAQLLPRQQAALLLCSAWQAPLPQHACVYYVSATGTLCVLLLPTS